MTPVNFGPLALRHPEDPSKKKKVVFPRTTITFFSRRKFGKSITACADSVGAGKKEKKSKQKTVSPTRFSVLIQSSRCSEIIHKNLPDALRDDDVGLCGKKVGVFAALQDTRAESDRGAAAGW